MGGLERAQVRGGFGVISNNRFEQNRAWQKGEDLASEQGLFMSRARVGPAVSVGHI